LQVFAQKISFVSHKKSFLGRFFMATKLKFFKQKAFHYYLGQAYGMV
jgi:hypothetical protein